MIKLVTFLKRGADLTRSGFEQRWKTVHAPLAAIFPGLRGYMLGFSRDEDEPPADGIAQLWFDSREAAQASYASDIGRKGSADASAYLNRRDHLLASEIWLRQSAPLSRTPFKIMLCLKRADDVSREAFIDWFRSDLAEDLQQTCDLGQLRISLDEKGQLLNSKVEGSLDLREGEAVFDGFIEGWAADLGRARQAREDLRAWSRKLQPHVSEMEDALLEEHVVVQPPAPAYGLVTERQR